MGMWHERVEVLWACSDSIPRPEGVIPYAQMRSPEWPSILADATTLVLGPAYGEFRPPKPPEPVSSAEPDFQRLMEDTDPYTGLPRWRPPEPPEARLAKEIELLALDSGIWTWGKAEGHTLVWLLPPRNASLPSGTVLYEDPDWVWGSRLLELLTGRSLDHQPAALPAAADISETDGIDGAWLQELEPFFAGETLAIGKDLPSREQKARLRLLSLKDAPAAAGLAPHSPACGRTLSGIVLKANVGKGRLLALHLKRPHPHLVGWAPLSWLTPGDDGRRLPRAHTGFTPWQCRTGLDLCNRLGTLTDAPKSSVPN